MRLSNVMRLSIAYRFLEGALANAEDKFQGTHFEEIFDTTREAIKSAKRLIFQAEDVWIMQNCPSFVYTDARETAQMAFQAEMMIRCLDYNTRTRFMADSCVDSALNHLNKMCHKMAISVREAIHGVHA